MNFKTKVIQSPCWYVGLDENKQVVQGHEKQELTEGQRIIVYATDTKVLAHIVSADNEVELDNLVAAFRPNPWVIDQTIDDKGKVIKRHIRCIVSNEALVTLSTYEPTSGFIPYVHSIGMPMVQTDRGIELYLEEVFPMPGVEDVTAALTALGCKFEYFVN
jgi:hypothetical protein